MTIEDLRAIPLFASLDEETLADTARRVQICHYRAGQYIIHEDQPAHAIFFVVRGRVRLSRTAPDGREQVLEMAGPGEYFNAVPIFDNGLSPASARAMSQVTCLLLARDDLLMLIRKHPDLALAALSDLAGQLRELVMLVEDLAFRSVRARLARLLLAEAAEGSAEVTQQELAERTGTVREIAGRALRRMAEERLVKLERGRVIVLDRTRLAKVAEE